MKATVDVTAYIVEMFEFARKRMNDGDELGTLEIIREATNFLDELHNYGVEVDE